MQARNALLYYCHMQLAAIKYTRNVASIEPIFAMCEVVFMLLYAIKMPQLQDDLIRPKLLRAFPILWTSHSETAPIRTSLDWVYCYVPCIPLRGMSRENLTPALS
jgi:hypothetical protein